MVFHDYNHLMKQFIDKVISLNNIDFEITKETIDIFHDKILKSLNELVDNYTKKNLKSNLIYKNINELNLLYHVKNNLNI